MIDLLIRDIKYEDLNEVVRIHQNAFPGFLMTLMGTGFLLEYYTIVLKYPKRIMLGALNSNGKLCGFIAGFINSADFYRSFSDYKIRMVIVGFFHILFRPKLWIRIWENMRKVKLTAHDFSHGGEVTAELASIAVDPAFLRRGCGKKLVKNFIHCARGMSVNSIELTTDMVDNDSVNEFYQSLGFVMKNAIDRIDGRRMCQYEYKFTSNLNE